MSSLIRSLTVLSYLVNVACAVSSSAQSSAISSSNLDWVDYILDAAILPSANASTDFDSNSVLSSHLNLSAESPVSCFTNPPPSGHAPFATIVVDDYLELLEKIAIEDDAMQLRTWFWGAGPQTGKSWTLNRCRVAVATPQRSPPPVPAAFQSIYIVHASAMIGRKCLTDARGKLGGVMRFGPNFQFTVMLGALRTIQADVATS